MISDNKSEINDGRRPVRRFVWIMTMFCTLAFGISAFPRGSLTAPMPNTVRMTDMTWVEVRSAVQHGYTVAIVPTGGVEQNGPQMVLGKHDYIIQYTTDRIAHALGNALVTPVVSFVPEGNYVPPSGNMSYPGTLGVPKAAFAAILKGIARSLKLAGFKTICFIGDHGLSQPVQAAVAAELNHKWVGQGVSVLDVSGYYKVDQPQTAYLLKNGETRATIGYHAGIMDTSELLAAHPQGVNLTALKALPWHSESTGASGDPTHASAAYGRALLKIKIDGALRQIKATLAMRAAPINFSNLDH